jgi:FKBP-type peptidyl-prolyl cis-trans isomerase FklB
LNFWRKYGSIFPNQCFGFPNLFDRGEPTTFAPNQVIKGWTEAMQMMVEGDKWELYIPSGKKLGQRNFDVDVP